MLIGLFKGAVGYGALGAVVAVCLVLGKWLNVYAPFLPSSLWGMLCFALGLMVAERFGLSAQALFQQPVQRIVKYLSFVFLPVCVGIIQYGDLIAQSGGKILLVGMSSTLVALSVIAWLSRKWLVTGKDD
jgi:holin-like protein